MFNKSIKELHEMLLSGAIKPSDLLNIANQNINSTNDEINAIITKIDNHDVDNLPINNILSGIPFSLKDNFNAKGYRTSAASEILSEYVSNFNSTMYETLISKHSIPVGKDNMDEFATGISTKSSYFGATINPNWKDRLVGGSSGGSAASVAAGYSMYSLGTETGGSVRLPAAWNGIVGFKPTYGALSRYGVISFASTLDTVGIFAKTVDDISVVYDELSQKDFKDATNTGFNIKTQETIENDIKNIKVAVLKDYEELPIDKNIISAITKATEIFKDISEVEIKHLNYTANIYYSIACVELFSNLSRFDGLRYGKEFSGDTWNEQIINTRSHFSTEVKKRIIVGASLVNSEENKKLLIKSKKLRSEIKESLEEILEVNDVLILPVTASLPPKNDEDITPELLNLTDQFTIISSLTGTPAISIPYGYSKEGLPVAIQLISKVHSDDKLLNIAHKIFKMNKEVK